MVTVLPNYCSAVSFILVKTMDETSSWVKVFFTHLSAFEGPMLHVPLDSGVGEIPTDQTLGVEDGVVGVHGHLVFSGIADQTLGVGEGNIRWSCSVTLKNNELFTF